MHISSLKNENQQEKTNKHKQHKLIYTFSSTIKFQSDILKNVIFDTETHVIESTMFPAMNSLKFECLFVDGANGYRLKYIQYEIPLLLYKV